MLNRLQKLIFSPPSLKNHLTEQVPLALDHYSEFSRYPKPIIRRMMSFSFDLMMIFILKISFILSLSGFVKTFFFQLHNSAQEELIHHLQNFDVSLTFLIYWGYFSLSMYLGEGKTVGKIFFKLTVVPRNAFQENQFSLSFWSCQKRTLGYLLAYLSAGLLFFINFTRKDQKGLPDLLSQSMTIGDEALYYYFLVKSDEQKVEEQITKSLTPEEVQVAA